MNNIIEIEGLSKQFKNVKALQNVSFNVKEGELFAYLGVNGAGKSTTISIICGQLKQDGGHVKIDGLDAGANLKTITEKIGVVFQNSVLDKALSVKDNLKSRAALYGIYGDAFKRRLSELLALLGFEKLIDRNVGKLSGGERRRIDIARALIHNPKILILDEPTTGLDPQTRKTLWNVVASLRRDNNVTVFLTTHYMEEAADADNIVILDDGRIVAEGTPLELKNTYSGDFVTVYSATEEQIKSLGTPYKFENNAFRISVPNTAAATNLIIQHPEIFTDYEITKGKMDDVFLAATGKKLIGDTQI